MRKQLVHLLLAVLAGAALALALVWLGAVDRAYAKPVATRNVDCSSGSDATDCTGSACLTIQHAIDVSSFGDTILVAAGTCNEHITMKEGVSIHGQGWSNTIIDGGHYMPSAVVYIPPGVSASTVLSGVQITNGRSSVVTDSITANATGGGIEVSYASPRIVNTWVNNCTARYGGGVYVNSGSPTFENVPVWSNQAERGGGFYLQNDAEVTIMGDLAFVGTNGTVLWNSATQDGGGFYMTGVTATLTALRINGNSAVQGGGVYVGSNPHRTALWLNDVSGNTATNAGAAGGGIYTYDATELELVLNFIGNGLLGNTSTHAIGSGAGAAFSHSAGLVSANWFLNNTTASNGSGGGATVFGSSADLTLSANWFEGNWANAGGGLDLGSGAAPMVDANTFVTNTAGGLGGAIYAYDAGAAMVSNNIVARNVSTNDTCGGIAVVESGLRVINNTVADNTGAGVWFAEAENVVIVNNIVCGNGTYGIEHYTFSTPPTIVFTTDYNDVWNNTSADYAGSPSPLGSNDLSLDPNFVGTGDARAYYHIQAGSPVSTTGSTTWAPARDIDAHLRLLGGSVSMGADEIPSDERTVYVPLVLRNAE